MPMPFSIICVSSSPARPTKGRPRLSSSAPGPSPMKRISALGLPSPNTIWDRFSQRPHRLQSPRCPTTSSRLGRRPAHGTGAPISTGAAIFVRGTGSVLESGAAGVPVCDAGDVRPGRDLACVDSAAAGGLAATAVGISGRATRSKSQTSSSTSSRTSAVAAAEIARASAIGSSMAP